jgi:hypothetical protein
LVPSPFDDLHGKRPASPGFFESLVLDLLDAMGRGKSRSDLRASAASTGSFRSTDGLAQREHSEARRELALEHLARKDVSFLDGTIVIERRLTRAADSDLAVRLVAGLW